MVIPGEKGRNGETGEFLNSDRTHNHDSCYEVYTNSYMCTSGTPRTGSSPGLSPAYGFEHPASTLPTRFPAALGIGHDRPAA